MATAARWDCGEGGDEAAIQSMLPPSGVTVYYNNKGQVSSENQRNLHFRLD